MQAVLLSMQEARHLYSLSGAGHDAGHDQAS